jgi:hypothetical protein
MSDVVINVVVITTAMNYCRLQLLLDSATVARSGHRCAYRILEADHALRMPMTNAGMYIQSRRRIPQKATLVPGWRCMSLRSR